MAEGPTPRIFGFHAARTRQLRRAGFEGDYVWVGIRDGALELIGEDSGFLRVPVQDIVRIRAGFIEAKPIAYRTILWCRGGGRPFYLYPQPSHHFLYTPAIRDLAAAVAAHGGIARVERGTSAADALLTPLLMAIPALGGVAVAAWIVTDATWWQRLAIPAIPLVLLALLGWRAVTRHFPRSVGTLSDLDRQLPRISP
ncbi:MAG TPA: hypothetical protein VFP12_18180 [Allosphingosinicella sp.]|nr:hypothetical protein [Allosphingosinicella sp.]